MSTLGMLGWGLFLMNIGLLMTLHTWMVGSQGGSSYPMALGPALVGLMIVGRAVRLLSSGSTSDDDSVSSGR